MFIVLEFGHHFVDPNVDGFSYYFQVSSKGPETDTLGFLELQGCLGFGRDYYIKFLVDVGTDSTKVRLLIRLLKFFPRKL